MKANREQCFLLPVRNSVFIVLLSCLADKWQRCSHCLSDLVASLSEPQSGASGESVVYNLLSTS